MKMLGKIILFLMAAIVVLPLAFTVLNAFMGNEEFFRYYGGLLTGGTEYVTLHLLPESWTAEGFVTVLLSTPEYLMKFWNSMGMTTAIALGQISVACLAGYGFSKFRFPFRDQLFVLVIILMMMPYQVTLVSNYIVLDQMNLIGGYASLILPGIFSAFGVFLMKQSMDLVPQDILESAKLDGAGPLRIFFSIVLPCVKSTVASLLILNFIDNWNMVEQPLIFLQKKSMYPLSVFLAESINGSGVEIFACGVLAMIPVMLLFMNFHEELQKGIEASGVK